MGVIMAACLMLATEGEIPSGCDSLYFGSGAARIQVFTYKPPNFHQGPMLVVCHGMLRNAAEYRDDARTLADRLGALIVAPCFPEDDFPYQRYQAGGLLNDGQLAPRETWTWQIVLDAVEEIRRREQRPEMAYFLFGHSGGAQFLVRMAGFVANDAGRIVVSNAGAQLFPSRELPYPYGFGGLPAEVSDDAALRRYLAQPMTLYVADDDRQRDEYLDTTDDADRQGANRRQRARNSFAAGRHLAKQKGWTFNWRLVTVPGVAHDHQKMLDHDLCAVALRPPTRAAKPPARRRLLHSSIAAQTRRHPLHR
jgi:hypothetical protein